MKINEIPELTEKQAFLVCAFNLASGVQIEMKTRVKFIRFENKAKWEKLEKHLGWGISGEKQKEWVGK